MTRVAAAVNRFVISEGWTFERGSLPMHGTAHNNLGMAEKDWWDKAEIAGKVGGAIVIPIVVGVSAAVLNSQISRRDQTARMSQIAIGILTEPAEEDTPGALREWAIAVLRNPSDPPPLSEDAALALRTERLTSVGIGSNFFDTMTNEQCIEHFRDEMGDGMEWYCSGVWIKNIYPFSIFAPRPPADTEVPRPPE